jgi:hypothetical protein
METTNRKQMIKKQYTSTEGNAYTLSMDKLGISKYKPITLLKRVIGYGLIGYGLVTAWLPSGSQLALLGGCALLGIPFSKVWDKIKLYGGRIWYVLKVLCSRKRLVYEFKLRFLKLRIWMVGKW